MSSVAEALADQIRGYCDRINTAANSYRELVPAPTDRVAIGLHTELRKTPEFRSYLALRPDMHVGPSRSEGRLLVEAITSVREGSFIAVLCPGTLSHVQESVRGSGSGIRNEAISDEWPWVQANNSEFEFDGPFLRAWMNAAGLHPESGDAVQSALRQIRIALSAAPQRSRILFDEILDRFTGRELGKTESFLALLRNAGIPCPHGIRDEQQHLIEQANNVLGTWIAESEKCAKEVSQAIAGGGARVVAIERVDEVARRFNIRPEALRRAVDAFLDRLHSQGTEGTGILSLRSGLLLGDAEWEILSTEVLIQLFLGRKTKATIDAEWATPQDQDARRFQGGRILVAPVGKVNSIDATPRGITTTVWEVAIKRGNKTLVRAAAIPNTSVSLQVGPLEPLATKLSVRLLEDGSELAASRLALEQYGPSRPLLVVIETCNQDQPAKDQVEFVYGTRSDEVVDETPTLTVRAESQVVLFAYPHLGVVTVELDGRAIPTLRDDSGGLLLDLPINSDSLPDGRGALAVRSGDHIAEFVIELGARGAGPLTAEDALREAIFSAKPSLVKNLLDVCAGEAPSEPYLGALRDQDKYRLLVARQAFESRERLAGHPVLLNLDECKTREVTAEGLIWTTRRSTLPGSLNGTWADVDAGAQHALDRYATARRSLMDAFAAHYAKHRKAVRPDYAEFPAAARDLNHEAQTAVDGYLQAYLLLLQELRSNGGGDRNYLSKFLLTFQDCLVHKASGEAGACFFLGPWHPLVIGRRNLVSSALIATAARFLDHKPARTFGGLAQMLRGIVGFRWVPGLSLDSGQLKAFYSAATSDPGWVVCASTVEGGLARAHSLARSIGLESDLVSSTGAGSASKYFRDYSRAFPSRRAIVAHIAGPQNVDDLLEESRRFLIEDGNLTNHGRMLRAGIHLLVDGKRDEQHEVPSSWTDPPVCLYEVADVSQMLTIGGVDLELSAPVSPVRIAPAGASAGSVPAPRGVGMAAPCYLPLRTLDQAAGHLSKSLCAESAAGTLPDEGVVSGAFVRAVAEAEAVAGPALSVTWTFSEPRATGAQWVVVPGEQADPAVFLDWTRTLNRHGERRVLWDYRLAITRSVDSYYVISSIPKGVAAILQGSPFLTSAEEVWATLTELAEVGIAVGSEAFKAKTKALGIIGLAGAVRVSRQLAECLAEGAAERTISFLIPVDSFQDLLTGTISALDDQGQPLDNRRADLLLVSTLLPEDKSEPLEITVVAIESKYAKGLFSSANVAPAILQSKSTLQRISGLAESGRHDYGIPERLALARIFEFGLRLGIPAKLNVQQECLSRILSGKYALVAPGNGCLLVSSEGELASSSIEQVPSGVWVRLSPTAWPGGRGAEQVNEVLRELFASFVPQRQQRAQIVRIVAPPEAAAASQEGNKESNNAPSKEAEIRQPSDSGEATPESKQLNVFIGTTETLEPVSIQPGTVENYNVMVTGSSGKGKTQLLKSMVTQFRDEAVPAILVDFKNDFAVDKTFMEMAHLTGQDVAEVGLPYNPLIPSAKPSTEWAHGIFQISQHVGGLASAFRGAFQLGDQQTNDVKEAIRAVLQERGIVSHGSIQADPAIEFPDFNDIGRHLRANNPKAYARLDPLFDLDVFHERYRRVPFTDLIGSGRVLNLSGVMDERVQNALAQILVYSAHRYLNSLAHSASLRQILLFDEAHRVLKTEYMEKLVRECRAYGLGVLLSSQFPDDFPKSTASNLATQIVHGNGADSDRVSAISKMLGFVDDDPRIAKMGLFEAIISSQRHPNLFVRTFSYPHLILLREISKGATSLEELIRAPGLMPGTAVAAVEHLRAMRLIDVRDGVIGAI